MKLLIVPHPEKPGRWALRWDNDSNPLGDFVSVDQAEKDGRFCWPAVEIVRPPTQPAGVPASITRSVNQRLADLAMPPIPEDRTLPLPFFRPTSGVSAG